LDARLIRGGATRAYFGAKDNIVKCGLRIQHLERR